MLIWWDLRVSPRHSPGTNQSKWGIFHSPTMTTWFVFLTVLNGTDVDIYSESGTLSFHVLEMIWIPWTKQVLEILNGDLVAEHLCALTGTAVWRCIGAAGFQWSLCRRPELWCAAPTSCVAFSLHFHCLAFWGCVPQKKDDSPIVEDSTLIANMINMINCEVARFWSSQFQTPQKFSPNHRACWDVGQLLSDGTPTLSGWGRGSFRSQLRAGSRWSEECSNVACNAAVLLLARTFRVCSETSKVENGRRPGGPHSSCSLQGFLCFLHWIIFTLQDSEVTWLLRLALRKQDGLSGLPCTDREGGKCHACFQPLRNHGFLAERCDRQNRSLSWK